MAKEIRKKSRLHASIQGGFSCSFQGEGSPLEGSSNELKQLNDINAPIGSEYLDLVSGFTYIKVDNTPSEDRGSFKQGLWKSPSENLPSTPDLETLSHFIYNPVSDKLVADKPIETTLSSLYLGEQHRMSSGGENVFFTNESSQINWYPMWGGLKDMNVAENKSAAGIIKPSARNYSSFSVIEINGAVDTGVTDAINQAVIPFAVSGVGADMVIEDTIIPSDTLFYNIYYGTDGDDYGNQAFESKKRGLTLNAGDSFEWIYEHPVETKAGQAIYARIDVESADGTVRPLQVRKAVNGLMYVTVQAFLFTDDDLAYKSDIEGIVSGSIYKGAYNAATDTPTLTLSGSEINGDFFRVSVSGGAYEVGDLIIFNGTTTSYDHIPVKSLTQESLETSSLKVYDTYVKANFTSPTKDGSALYPYSEIQTAVDAASDGDSIFLDGEFNIANEIVLPNKSLYFYGSDTTQVKYSSYSATNDNIMSFDGDGTKELSFVNIKYRNAGEYALYLKNLSNSKIENCDFKYNGWDGSTLNTIASSSVTGLYGYDSTQAELQSFYAGSNASSGGAVRIENSKVVELIGNVVSKNLRGLRIQDCGVGGYGYVTRNQVSENIESGIYLASSSYDATNGCENFTVYNNACKYNANNGTLVIGGINNVISLNIVEGNWNAGIMPWHVSNTIIRDNYLLNNNRSEFNGIGNVGDAGASLEIAGGTLKSTAKFILHAINNQIVDTGIGNSTTTNGIKMSSSLDAINNRSISIILLDNNTMQGQDYALVKSCDLDKIRLIKGDNTYIDSLIQDTLTTGVGDYYELPYSNQHTDAKFLDFCLDATGTQVGVKDSDYQIINYFSINQLKALDFLGNIRIKLLDSNKIQFDDVPPTGVSIEGVPLTGTVSEKVNAINALVQGTGSSSGQAPTITSNLQLSMAVGDTLNYELTADYGVGYEWDLSNVSGVSTVEGNVRKILGGSTLVSGTYNIPVKAINYNGEDSKTLVLTVDAPAFSNTKSINFANQDYLGANASLLANTLGRVNNGSGASEAWSISMWYKGSANTQGQTIFYFGDSTTTNGGHIVLHQININGAKGLRFRYGHQYNRIQLQTTGITANTWQHILITYDGGTTGSQSTQMSQYYGRFNIFIDGALKSTTNSHTAFGYNQGISADNLRVGRYSSGNYMRDCRVDELAIWDTDESGDISDIYNGGATFDLSTLATEPKHWWRMGDGDTYPYIQDNGTSGNCIFQMYNQTAADIVSDTP